MSRFTSSALGFLLLTAGCMPALSTRNSHPGTTGSQDYTLRLVFDGLVTLREPSSDQKNAWILIGNASKPDKLMVGKKIPPHMSHLLVRVKDENGVEEATVLGRPLDPPLVGAHGLPGTWQATTLDGEDLSLDANTETKLELIQSRLWSQQPCNPKHWFFFCWEGRSRRQRENLAWTVHVSDALARIPGNPHDKEFKECLTQDTYGCTGSPLLLNARVKLAKGRIFVNKLFGQKPLEEGGNLPHFVLAADRPLSEARAQAEEVAAEFVVRGPVDIHSRNLDGSVGKAPLRIEGRPGRTVEVRIGNHPNCRTLIACQKQGFTDQDFLFTFNLLNNPLFIDVSKLPVPRQEPPPPGPGFNSQCSPSSYRPGG